MSWACLTARGDTFTVPAEGVTIGRGSWGLEHPSISRQQYRLTVNQHDQLELLAVGMHGKALDQCLSVVDTYNRQEQESACLSVEATHLPWCVHGSHPVHDATMMLACCRGGGGGCDRHWGLGAPGFAEQGEQYHPFPRLQVIVREAPAPSKSPAPGMQLKPAHTMHVCAYHASRFHVASLPHHTALRVQRITGSACLQPPLPSQEIVPGRLTADRQPTVPMSEATPTFVAVPGQAHSQEADAPPSIPSHPETQPPTQAITCPVIDLTLSEDEDGSNVGDGSDGDGGENGRCRDMQAGPQTPAHKRARHIHPDLAPSTVVGVAGAAVPSPLQAMERLQQQQPQFLRQQQQQQQRQLDRRPTSQAAKTPVHTSAPTVPAATTAASGDGRWLQGSLLETTPTPFSLFYVK